MEFDLGPNQSNQGNDSLNNFSSQRSIHQSFSLSSNFSQNSLPLTSESFQSLQSSPISIGSPNRVYMNPQPIKPTNPLEYSPYINFSEWKRRARACNFSVVLSDRITFPIPQENVFIYENALSLSYKWTTALDIRLPLKLSITGGFNENLLYSVGDKRKIDSHNNDNINPVKKIKTGHSSQSPITINSNSSQSSNQKTRTLFIDNIIQIRDGYWTDKSGKIIVLASIDNGPNSIKIHQLYFNSHGQKFLPEQRRTMQSHIRDKLLGFKNYSVYITLRDCKTNSKLFEFQQLNNDIQRIESPFRQTVSLQILKNPINLRQILVPPGSFNSKYEIPPRFIADITIFDCYHNNFFTRSGFLWVNSHSSNIYYCSMLAPPTEYGYLSIEFKVTPTHTELRSCSITLYLSKIVSWFDKHFNGHKIPIVSKILLENEPKEDPFDIFNN